VVVWPGSRVTEHDTDGGRPWLSLSIWGGIADGNCDTAKAGSFFDLLFFNHVWILSRVQCDWARGPSPANRLHSSGKIFYAQESEGQIDCIEGEAPKKHPVRAVT
jgi:hypothetical protein